VLVLHLGSEALQPMLLMLSPAGLRTVTSHSDILQYLPELSPDDYLEAG
jgi:hypothetical protein